MAISQVGNALGGGSNNGGDVTLTFSAAPAAGDLIIVFGGRFTRTVAGKTYGPHSGYSELWSSNTLLANYTIGIWTKVAVGNESNVVCDGSGNSSDGTSYVAYVQRGVNNSVIKDITPPATASGSASTPDPPASGATATDNTLAIAFAANAVSDTNLGNVPSGYGSGTPNANGNDTNALSTAGATKALPTAGTNDNPGTWSGWSNGVWLAVTLVLRAKIVTTITPGQGDLTADSVAPTILWTDDHYASPARVDLAITPVAPYATNANAASILDENLQPILDEDSAFILDETYVPPGANVDRTPDAADLALTYAAPTVERTDDQFRTVPQGDAAISSVAPTLTTRIGLAPARVDLAITSVEPALKSTVGRAPSSVDLAITSEAPVLTTRTALSPDHADLALTSVEPALTWNIRVSISPDRADLSLITFIPTVGGMMGVSPPQGNLALTSLAPAVRVTISPAAAQLALSSAAPSISRSLFPATADLALSSVAPRLLLSVSPTAAQLATSSVAPAMATRIGRTPARIDLALTSAAPSLKSTVGRTPARADLALSSVAPALAYRIAAAPARVDLALTSVAPTVTSAGRVLSPSAAQLASSSEVPTPWVASPAAIYDENQLPILDENGDYIYDETFVGDVDRYPEAAQLTMSTTLPSVVQRIRVELSPAHADLAISSVPPSTGGEVTLEPDGANLTLSTVAPTRSITTARQPAAAQLALSTVAPTVLVVPKSAILDQNSQPILDESGDFILDETYAITTVRQPAGAQLALSTVAPVVRVIPYNALLDEDGEPILDENGDYIIAPTVVLSPDLSPPAANLFITRTSPYVVQTIPGETAIVVTRGNLVITSDAPDIATGAAFGYQPPSGDLELTLRTPAVTLTNKVPVEALADLLVLPAMNLSITTSRNADWRMRLPIFVGGGGAPVDLTGVNFLLQVWRRLPGHEVSLAASSARGEITIEGANNHIMSAHVPASRMARLELGTWPISITASTDDETVDLAVGTLTHAPVGGPIVKALTAVPREDGA